MYKTMSEAEGRAGNRVGQAISLKLLLRCLMTTSGLVAEISHMAGTGPEGLEASLFLSLERDDGAFADSERVDITPSLHRLRGKLFPKHQGAEC